MRCWTYVRLSASRLGADAPGLERQQADLDRLATERGWEITGRLRDADVRSYRDVERPGFAELRSRVDARRAGARGHLRRVDLPASLTADEVETLLEVAA